MREIPRRSARAVLAVFTGAIVIGAAGIAAAPRPQKKGGPVEGGGGGGGHPFNKNVELGVADDQGNPTTTPPTPPLTSPQNAPLFLLRLGVLPHPMFAIEAEGVGIPTKARDTGASAFIIGARGSLVYNIMPGQIAGGKFVPFILAGAGIFNVASSNGDMSTDL